LIYRKFSERILLTNERRPDRRTIMGVTMPCYFQVMSSGEELLSGGSKSPDYINWLEIASWRNENWDVRDPDKKIFNLILLLPGGLPVGMARYLTQPLKGDRAALECVTKDGDLYLVMEFSNPTLVAMSAGQSTTIHFTFTMVTITLRNGAEGIKHMRDMDGRLFNYPIGFSN
jgi:hypothetical protein